MSDLLLYNARVLTQGTLATATAVAIRDGRIVAAGDDAGLSRATNGHTRRIDLGGRTLIPGFNDAHAHVWKIGHLLTSMLDVRRATSIGGIVDDVRGACERLPPSAWVLGRGFNEAALVERRMLTRHDLDRASLDRPIALTRTCGHIYAVNRAALARASMITIAEALRAYTIGGAVASGDEANRGSIEAGKWADLTVLSADPTTTDADNLSAIRVDMTLVAGRVVYER